MMLGKVIQELNQEGFLSNRDSTGNVFVTKKDQRKMETKLYKELNRF
jgi:DNA-binding transcriptional regulator YhcF (GntR family)